MRITLSDGRLVEGDLPGPGGTFCFSVGSPDGPRSAVWAVQAPAAKRDVYIANLAISGFQKVSLHQSGDWRYAWTREYAVALGLKGQGRIIEQWARPSGAVPGWTEALQIWFLHDELSEFSGLPQPDDRYFRDVCQPPEEITWIPSPGPGKALGAFVLLGTPDREEVTFDGYWPVGGFELAAEAGNYEACLVFVAERVLSDDDYALVRDCKAQMPIEEQLAEEIANRPSLRAYLFGKGLRDVPSFWDVKLPSV